jgi:PAS domain S-box-containing protein
MDPVAPDRRLGDLAAVCAAATDLGELREDVAPLLGALEGAWREAGQALVDSAQTRLRTAAELADLVARVDNAQQLANMGDYDWHIPTDTNRWSDQLFRIYGHEPQSFSLSYDKFLEQVHPDDRERITAIHQRAYATGEPYAMVERIVRPDGEVRYLSSNGRVILGEDGAPERMRGTCIDITEQVLAEHSRERGAARFGALVESCPDAILVLDGAGAVVLANHRADDLLGGAPVGHLVRELFADAVRTEEDVPATGLDGRRLRIDVTTAELTVDDEVLTAVFLRDATVRLEAEALVARLREAQVRRRQALEINDNVVQGLTAAIQALEHRDVAAASSYVDRIMTSARRMMHDLLDPLDGEDLRPGDLVRSAPARLHGDEVPVQVPGPRRIRGEGERYRVVVVDDAEDIRTLLRIKLEQTGRYEVVGEAEDGEEAVARATEQQPDLVLLDLAMPRMDGLQALPLICSAVPGVRVVVLSGFDADPMADKAFAAGAAHYIEKGRAISTLDQMLTGVMNKT